MTTKHTSECDRQRYNGVRCSSNRPSSPFNPYIGPIMHIDDMLFACPSLHYGPIRPYPNWMVYCHWRLMGITFDTANVEHYDI